MEKHKRSLLVAVAALMLILSVAWVAPTKLSMYEGASTHSWQGMGWWGTDYWFFDENGYPNPPPSGWGEWNVGVHSFTVDPDHRLDGVPDLIGEVTDAELAPECRDLLGNPKPAYKITYKVGDVEVEAGIYYFLFVIKVWTQWESGWEGIVWHTERDGYYGETPLYLRLAVNVWALGQEGDYRNFAAILAVECLDLKMGKVTDEGKAVDSISDLDPLDLPKGTYHASSPSPTIGSEFNYWVREGDTLRAFDMSYAKQIAQAIKQQTPPEEVLAPDPRLPESLIISLNLHEFGPGGSNNDDPMLLMLVRVHVLKVSEWTGVRRAPVPVGTPFRAKWWMSFWKAFFKQLFGIDLPEWAANVLGWLMVAVIVIIVGYIAWKAIKLYAAYKRATLGLPVPV